MVRRCRCRVCRWRGEQPGAVDAGLPGGPGSSPRGTTGVGETTMARLGIVSGQGRVPGRATRKERSRAGAAARRHEDTDEVLSSCGRTARRLRMRAPAALVRVPQHSYVSRSTHTCPAVLTRVPPYSYVCGRVEHGGFRRGGSCRPGRPSRRRVRRTRWRASMRRRSASRAPGRGCRPGRPRRCR